MRSRQTHKGPPCDKAGLWRVSSSVANPFEIALVGFGGALGFTSRALFFDGLQGVVRLFERIESSRIHFDSLVFLHPVTLPATFGGMPAPRRAWRVAFPPACRMPSKYSPAPSPCRRTASIAPSADTRPSLTSACTSLLELASSSSCSTRATVRPTLAAISTLL